MKLFLGFLEYENLELSPANLRYLDSSEKEKLKQFTDEPLKREFIAGRILAKSLLSAELGIELHRVRIEIHPSGRPISKVEKQFSLSHSKGLAACAIGQDLLGLDLERKLQRKHYISIAKDFFHETEFARIKFGNSATSLQLFYEYWTIKEAYIKANNMSIWNLKLVPPAKTSCKLSPENALGKPNIESHSIDSGNSQIEAVSYTLSDEYILAIASSPAPHGITIAPNFPFPKRLSIKEAKRYTFD